MLFLLDLVGMPAPCQPDSCRDRSTGFRTCLPFESPPVGLGDGCPVGSTGHIQHKVRIFLMGGLMEAVAHMHSTHVLLRTFDGSTIRRTLKTRP